MAIGPGRSTVIVVLHDDGLLAGIAAGQHDDDLAGLRRTMFHKLKMFPTTMRRCKLDTKTMPSPPIPAPQ
eukprot:366031-Chlamydomonas_euryale.AAC.18